MFHILYYVEQSTQSKLLDILSKLYQNLLDNKRDNLFSFFVIITGINPLNLTNNLGKKIIWQICEIAAGAEQLQCGKKYCLLIKIM